MDDIGCRWTVWADHGNTPGLPEKETRASALSGSVRSLIETCQPASQPVGVRPVNHSRLTECFDKVTRNRPAGSSFLVKPPPGLWEVLGAGGFQATVGTRAQSERVSRRGGTFHRRPRGPLLPLDSRGCYQLAAKPVKAPRCARRPLKW
jgi:hypothetical protein